MVSITSTTILLSTSLFECMFCLPSFSPEQFASSHRANRVLTRLAFGKEKVCLTSRRCGTVETMKRPRVYATWALTCFKLRAPFNLYQTSKFGVL